MPPIRRDLTGQRFGRLVVASWSHASNRGQQYWNCRCDCGETVVRRGSELSRPCKSGVVSCGCSMREETRKRTTIHGRYGSLTYVSWCAMKRRCLNPGHPAFASYGGRGIRVCERWMTFDNFLADMGERPSKTTSIDRVNVNGDYEPANCRWTTPREQARNARSTKLTPALVRLIRESATAGIKQKDIAKDLGMAKSSVSMVINRRTWSDVA